MTLNNHIHCFGSQTSPMTNLGFTKEIDNNYINIYI